jgi:hypothetical protein
VAKGALEGDGLTTTSSVFVILWVWSFQQAGAVLVGAVDTPGMVYGLLRNKSLILLWQLGKKRICKKCSLAYVGLSLT